ncbi:hypothetical protein IFR04_016096, partial [Cadophora malorum]
NEDDIPLRIDDNSWGYPSKTKSTLVRRVVEAEFGDLGFVYIEAHTPQQKDGWSCALMVIRNAKQRMNGLSVGAWNSKGDPDRVTRKWLGIMRCILGLTLFNHKPFPRSARRRLKGFNAMFRLHFEVPEDSGKMIRARPAQVV